MPRQRSPSAVNVGDDGVGVAGCSVLDQGRGSRQHERGRGGDGRHDHDAQDRPGPPPERDQRDRRLDVGERRIEAADRPGGERFEAGQQDGVLLMLHSVRRVGEDRAPDVPFHVQRVRLGRPHRPAVPDVESGGGTEAEDPNREHCEEHKGGELERPGDRAGPGKLELPEARRSPAEDDPGDEQGGDGQHAGGCRADVDPHHRTQDRDEAARREAHGERQAEDGRKPASVPPYSRQQHDGRAHHRDAAVQQHESDRVAHDRRRPSQTPSTTSTSAKASEIGGEGAPKTITASALREVRGRDSGVEVGEGDQPVEAHLVAADVRAEGKREALSRTKRHAEAAERLRCVSCDVCWIGSTGQGLVATMVQSAESTSAVPDAEQQHHHEGERGAPRRDSCGSVTKRARRRRGRGGPFPSRRR